MELSPFKSVLKKVTFLICVYKNLQLLIDTQVKEKYLFYTIISRRDEIGRRARLKIWWSLLRVGSTPTAGNKI